MSSNFKNSVVAGISIVSSLISACSSNIGDNTETPPEANAAVASLQNMPCQTFGFRNWSLQQGDGTVKVSGEAMMPTPAWSVVLHHDMSGASDGPVELVMETIEPSGLSSSVVSWVNFDTSVSTDESSLPDVTVECAGEIVWDSGAV